MMNELSRLGYSVSPASWFIFVAMCRSEFFRYPGRVTIVLSLGGTALLESNRSA
jgi:hypothetical protein